MPGAAWSLGGEGGSSQSRVASRHVGGRTAKRSRGPSVLCTCAAPALKRPASASALRNVTPQHRVVFSGCPLLHSQTLVSEYHDNGYLFEQYDDRTGRGTSSHPFTGWTALVALIATNSY